MPFLPFVYMHADHVSRKIDPSRGGDSHSLLRIIRDRLWVSFSCDTVDSRDNLPKKHCRLTPHDETKSHVFFVSRFWSNPFFFRRPHSKFNSFPWQTRGREDHGSPRSCGRAGWRKIWKTRGHRGHFQRNCWGWSDPSPLHRKGEKSPGSGPVTTVLYLVVIICFWTKPLLDICTWGSERILQRQRGRERRSGRNSFKTCFFRGEFHQILLETNLAFKRQLGWWTLTNEQRR